MKHIITMILFISMSVLVVECVPPSLANPGLGQLQAELSTVKNTIKVLSDQWEKWNTLFVTSLEPRITSTASTLASIDSNIHNLQERAHVWDTFQLHVAAWNDQLASMDRKIDIINKGQEKVLALDGKLNAVLSMEYKLDNTIKALKNIESTASSLDTILTAKTTKIYTDPLLNEFTSRGVLSAIKSVERKLDRLLLPNQNWGKGVEKPKLQVKCNIPRMIEDLLNDVSSKVDVIFDNITNDKEESDDYEEYVDVEGSGATMNIKRSLGKNKATKCAQSCKQSHKLLKEVLNKTKSIETYSKQTLEFVKNIRTRTTNGEEGEPTIQGIYGALEKEHLTLNIQRYQKIDQAMEVLLNRTADIESIPNKMHDCGKSSLIIEELLRSALNTENITKLMYNRQNMFSLKQLLSDETRTLGKDLNDVLKAHFSEQRAYLETIVDTNMKQCFRYNFLPTTKTHVQHISTSAPLPEVPSSSRPTTVDFQPTWRPVLDRNKSSCEDLSYDDPSGVYIFEKDGLGDGNVSYKKRYCDIQNDGLWTVIQRRDDYSTQHNFNATWEDYEQGFGDLSADFWMGNDFLQRISAKYNLILRVELEDFENNHVWAEYDKFQVLDATQNYTLVIGGYTGNASDSFLSHNRTAFSTYDRRNDQAPECCPCAVSYGGGWWFNRCLNQI
ncbi:unnamed protein product [Acanthoscelides obtectus]|uniref:Fibrinogen C-terminal domain-containing protein n=2 Tax=Acanthoscelides obtectus TaxID=200917 RepID=A0A9P0KLC5_ACAOB|nr:unnamed protein product [Acanthoscelides obtectus]CAK1639566.1 hypothetical protein AOBTE_LOCUS11247 [Acanthoscelides obtectus]